MVNNITFIISDVQHPIKKLISEFSNDTRIYIMVNNTAEIICKSDLAIGAAGSSSWERCCIGLQFFFGLSEEQLAKVINSMTQVLQK